VRFTVNVTPPADLDRDGMPDLWEQLYDLNNADGDRDHDGQTALAEYLSGTDPNDPSSFLHMTGIAPAAGGAGVVLRWASVGGIRYRVQVAEEVSGPFKDLVRPAAEELDAASPGTPGVGTYTDTSPVGGSPRRFYRVRVVTGG